MKKELHMPGKGWLIGFADQSKRQCRGELRQNIATAVEGCLALHRRRACRYQLSGATRDIPVCIPLVRTARTAKTRLLLLVGVVSTALYPVYGAVCTTVK